MQDVSEFNISFVKLVEAHPCLYDTTNDDYYRGQVQDQAWSSIAGTIGPNVTVKECKARWRNLRGRFTKHLKNYTSTDSMENNKRPYYLAEHLEFLLPFTKSKKSACDDEDIHYEDNISRFLEIDSFSDHITENEDAGQHDEMEFKYQHRSPSESDHIERLDHERQHAPKMVQNVGPNNSSLKRNTCLGPDGLRYGLHNKYRRLSNSGQRMYAGNAFDEGCRSQPAQDMIDYRDSDTLFLLSLLPDLKRMNDIQKRNYKIGILHLGGEILNEFNAQPNTSTASSIRGLVRRSSSYMSPDSGVPRSQRKSVQPSENGESNDNSTSN